MNKILFILIMSFVCMGALPIQENTYDYVPQEKFRVMCPYEFDLCGVNTLIPYYIPKSLPVVWGNIRTDLQLIITKVFIVYTEATDASVPISNQIRIGNKVTSDYHVDWTPRANAALWDVDTIIPSSFNNQGVYNDGNHDVLIIRSLGGKSGTGKVMITIEFSRNIEDKTLAN